MEAPKFPTRITFEDTGERRYPQDGENYRWANVKGEISQMCLFDAAVQREFEQDGAFWAVLGDHFAIYKLVEEK